MDEATQGNKAAIQAIAGKFHMPGRIGEPEDVAIVEGAGHTGDIESMRDTVTPARRSETVIPAKAGIPGGVGAVANAALHGISRLLVLRSQPLA